MYNICKHFYQYCIHISLYFMAIVLTVLHIHSRVDYDQYHLNILIRFLAYKPLYTYETVGEDNHVYTCC
jgi:hypothetical protein